MKFYTYPIVRDFGFAPNPFGGYCTLATCKPLLRKHAAVGDWIFGTTSVTGHSVVGRLVYAMRVDEKLTFNEYWHDPRFFYKKPTFNGSLIQCYGDNIYHLKSDAKWHQEDSHHSLNGGATNMKNLRNDTQWPNVLISRRYYYFGKNHVVIPEDIKVEMCHNKRVPTYKEIPEPIGQQAIKWLSDQFSQCVILGVPFHLNNSFTRFAG
ncbi:MAG: hypothetical protein EOP56_07545 [Sphingobacteriales bacterium]|nr:MAG: hypothetical protein EOP56_07545 [Sphingobacteriales bacterium]